LLGSSSGDRSRLLTVFMTEAGDIDRANLQTDAANDQTIYPAAMATAGHFAAIGIAKERIGPIGSTEVYEGHFGDDKDLQRLRVIYAWPRRPNEPAATAEPPEQPVPAAANDDPAVNRRIAEHYFPDLYTYPKQWPRADPWVLLDRQGKVLETGRRVVMSGRDVQLYVESLYPGIRTEGFQPTTIQGDHGQWADVGFVWLAPDSPVNDPATVDLSKRHAVLLYADVSGDGMTRWTELMALKVGTAAVTACSLQNPFGVVHLEVTTADIGPDAVTVRIRIQHASLSTAADMPAAGETAWSPESAPVSAPYGGSAELKLTDQQGKVWTLVLHPDRLRGGMG
jgi:hypothetical protein